MLSVPKFSSETEEADWWYDHRDDLEREFREAAAQGRLRLVRNVVRNGKVEQVPVSRVAIPSEDMSRAEKVAERKGVGVHDLVSDLLHEALLREEAAATH